MMKNETELELADYVRLRVQKLLMTKSDETRTPYRF